MSIVYIQISNSYLQEFLNTLLYVEANFVWMCRWCLYSAVIFNSKLDYSVLKSFVSAFTYKKMLHYRYKEDIKQISAESTNFSVPLRISWSQLINVYIF